VVESLEDSHQDGRGRLSMEAWGESLENVWREFLAEWPLERLRSMTLPEYSHAGDSRTFTAWIESRLDQLGSIWGGSSFKFGIYSRKNKSSKSGGAGKSYSESYAWYSKYGSTPEEAFAKVRSLVAEVAEAAARGDFASIDSVDLGTAYKWKIAFHYQDRRRPGVVSVFNREVLETWLRSRGERVPAEMSDIYRRVLDIQGEKEPFTAGKVVWEETVAAEGSSATRRERPRDFEELADEDAAEEIPLNLILYGPPGTGKTYATSELAVRICDGVVPDSREALLARYRELSNLRRVRFVTFHPSFNYEEFVEGIRPRTTEDGRIHYEVRPGVLKQAVTQARELYERRAAPARTVELADRRLYKMSLGDTTKPSEAWIFGDCLENEIVCLGFAAGVDFSGADDLQAVKRLYLERIPEGKETDYDARAIHYFKNELRAGDLVLISEGNRRFRGLAEIRGDYRFEAREVGYEHQRPVRWLWTSEESLPIDLIFGKILSQMSIYLMDQSAVRWDALAELISPKQAAGEAPNCVLVIDEINRANLAKAFGELITLLEPSKRLGEPDEKQTELPYSGDRFGVPPNLYVIGTMNTADRSIALMDTALRRRFAFREMAPRVDVLEQDLSGIDLRLLLDAMNRRIERIYDRDHVLGHTYLLGVRTVDDLIRRFEMQIIPLLQEYFFEDWRRIQQVFNDSDKSAELQIIQDLDRPGSEPGASSTGRRYQVNPKITPAAIQKIYA
jgi:5-methylcytosine-specific restriction protein B